MKLKLLSFTFWLSAVTARASVLPVIDAAHIAQDASNEITNLGHWISTEAHTLNTELNTLHQYENMVVQLARFGDPAALKNLPGISTVAQLYGSGQQLLQTYNQIKQMATSSPQQLQGSLNSLISAYRLQTQNPLVPSLYQFPTASYSVSVTIQDQMIQLEKQRQELEKQRDQALSSMQSASTASDVQKYHAAVSGINGALADVSARANELAQKSQLQQQQLNAGAQIQQLQATEQVVAGYGTDVNGSISTLENLSGGYGQLAHWTQ